MLYIFKDTYFFKYDENLISVIVIVNDYVIHCNKHLSSHFYMYQCYLDPLWQSNNFSSLNH